MLHTIILQLHEGARARDFLEYLRTFGVVRAVFPAAECGPPKLPAYEEETVRLEWGGMQAHELIDSDCPIPYGLDPEAVAAARRIARRLAAP